MRSHSWFRSIELRPDADRVRTIVAPENLVSARLEAVLSLRYNGDLDLIFESGGRYWPVTLAIVEGTMLIQRESDPITWPRWTRSLLGPGVMDELLDRVYPWLRSRVLARAENDRALHFYRDGGTVREDVLRAGALGLYGAAPLLDVARSLAAASYALRFSWGRSVGVFDPSGANGAALLCGRARRVDMQLGDLEQEAFVRRWFGALEIGEAGPNAAYDVVVGERNRLPRAPVRVIHGEVEEPGETAIGIARPLPTGVLVSFDPADSVLDGSLAVSASPVPTRACALDIPPVVGGSGGRVAIVVREDWLQAPDADTDAIRALTRRLVAEGFEVDVRGASRPVRPDGADIIHVVGHRHAASLQPSIAAAKQARIPIVVMPYLDDRHHAALWGASTLLGAVRSSPDDAFLDQYLGSLAARRLVWETPLPLADPVADPNVKALLQAAAAVVVVSDQEANLLRTRYGYDGPVSTVPAIFDPAAAADVAALAGPDDFVLFHAPLEPRTGAIFAILAAAREDIPIVVVGAVANAEYYAYLRAAAGDRAVLLAEATLDAGQIAGLYARARVFVDASWSGTGLHRLARAGAFGAHLVASSSSLAHSVWGELLEEVEPAAIDAIAAGLRRAWDAAETRGPAIARRTAERCEQFSALVGVVTAYQQAASPVVP